ncbi:hypothetical protein C8Q79DRAFT_922352 [Trametes meyenii]|nr:hypothetical protein C8Q79DRAFT_922352 [Trametes meyenii]
MSSPTSIPDDFVLDVHDLATIILDTHARTDTLFPHAQLVEINRGDTPLATFPEHFLHPSWHDPARKRVAYILDANPSAQELTTIDTFASPNGVKTPEEREPSRRELEDVFWRCKDFNNGYVLAYVAQRVFDSLPPTATLRVRTSTKHEVLCSPSRVTVAEIDIRAKEACLVVVKESRPDLGPSKVDMAQRLSGFTESMSWVFLLIGEAQSTDMEADPRVVLDLALPQIGGRGGGAEPFALERAIVYHEKVLSKVADEFDRYVLSGKLRITEDEVRRHADGLVQAVMDRVANVAAGQDRFCRYCGKDGVDTRCSKWVGMEISPSLVFSHQINFTSLYSRRHSSSKKREAVSDGPKFLDMHDLAVWILHAHATTDGAPFSSAHLIELKKNGAPLETVCEHEVPSEWSDPHFPRRAAYVLLDAPDAADKATVDTFLLPQVRIPNDQALTRKEVEDIFWRCKAFDQGYQLAFVAQSLLEMIPAAVQLRARTASGYEMIFGRADLMVGNLVVSPREACMIIRVNRSVSLSGFDGSIPWPYLLLGNDPDVNKRIVLDLALSQLGSRGSGAEPFVLERHDKYLQEVIPKYAVVHERHPLTMGIVPLSASPETRARAVDLVHAVRDRIVNFAVEGADDFCRYCGEAGVRTYCGVCKTAYFCQPCHQLGWKYHKRWCSPTTNQT